MSEVLVAGTITLDVPRATLTGPSGARWLTCSQRIVMERLMRRPGIFIPNESLISALWPNPDLEPEHPTGCIRVFMLQLRKHLVAVQGGPEPVHIRALVRIGYAIQGWEAPRRFPFGQPADLAVGNL